MATAHPKAKAKAGKADAPHVAPLPVGALPYAVDGASSSSSGSQWVKRLHRTVGVFAEKDSETSSVSEVQRRVEREHAAGTCNPCIFVASRQGCRFGEHCRFCHGVHPNRSLPAENTHF